MVSCAISAQLEGKAGEDGGGGTTVPTDSLTFFFYYLKSPVCESDFLKGRKRTANNVNANHVTLDLTYFFYQL